jgi:hypothetical protein
MSSTHNEFRSAACPLSGVRGSVVRAPCQLILGRVGSCAVSAGLKYGIHVNSFMRQRNLENRLCPYCERQFEPSRSHPHQVVCSSEECQRRRRADYHRKKLTKDPLYRALCRDSQDTWKQRNPEYMKQYRAGQRKAKPDRSAARPLITELARLLSLVKNNLGREHLGTSCITFCIMCLAGHPERDGLG